MQHPLRVWLAVAVLLTPLGAGCLNPDPAAASCPMAGCREAIQAACCCAERPAPASGSRDDGPALRLGVASAPTDLLAIPSTGTHVPARRCLLIPPAARAPLYLLHASFLV